MVTGGMAADVLDRGMWEVRPPFQLDIGDEASQSVHDTDQPVIVFAAGSAGSYAASENRRDCRRREERDAPTRLVP